MFSNQHGSDRQLKRIYRKLSHLWKWEQILCLQITEPAFTDVKEGDPARNPVAHHNTHLCLLNKTPQQRETK